MILLGRQPVCSANTKCFFVFAAEPCTKHCFCARTGARSLEEQYVVGGGSACSCSTWNDQTRLSGVSLMSLMSCYDNRDLHTQILPFAASSHTPRLLPTHTTERLHTRDRRPCSHAAHNHHLHSAPHTTRQTPCLLYTSPSPRDGLLSRMPSSA